MSFDERAGQDVRRRALGAQPPDPPLGHVVAWHHEYVVEDERDRAEQLGQIRDQARELLPYRFLSHGVVGGGVERKQRIEPVATVGTWRYQIHQFGDWIGAAPAGERP